MPVALGCGYRTRGAFLRHSRESNFTKSAPKLAHADTIARVLPAQGVGGTAPIVAALETFREVPSVGKLAGTISKPNCDQY
eukprot:282413-Rhodomonas_salina.1